MNGMPRAAAQLSNYNPTCHSGVGWSLSCPLAGFSTSDQYKWLVKDLASVNRAVTPCAAVLLSDPCLVASSASQMSTLAKLRIVVPLRQLAVWSQLMMTQTILLLWQRHEPDHDPDLTWKPLLQRSPPLESKNNTGGT